MLLQILFCLFLNNHASARDTLELAPVKEIIPAATTGAFKEQFNCLAANTYYYRINDEKVVRNYPFAGTHNGKSGFYVLTNKALHFYAVDEKTHSACFQLKKPVPADLEPNPYGGYMQGNGDHSYATPNQKSQDQKPSQNSKKNARKESKKETHAQDKDESIGFSNLDYISDQYFFKLDLSGEPISYISYSLNPDAKKLPDTEDMGLYMGSYSPGNAMVLSTSKEPKGKTTCTLTDHQIVDEESNADLDTFLIDHIKSASQIFEHEAVGTAMLKNNPYRKSNKAKETEPSNGKVEAADSSPKLPNPQNYINQLEACKNVKSKLVAKTLEKELAKFKVQNTTPAGADKKVNPVQKVAP